MILVAGIADEGPTERVIAALEDMGAAYRVFDQRDHARTDIRLSIGSVAEGGVIGGTISLAGTILPLEGLRGLYLRIMDSGLLPGIAALPAHAPERLRCNWLHETLLQFADIAACRVLNRPSEMGSNSSKPYQAHAIRSMGFGIPETLITNDPAAAKTFIEAIHAENGAVIYKSISGVRSIVQTVGPDDLARLERIRWCPTQFQRRVPGVDVRVHVVGQSTYAVEIDSDATDYRYASRQIGEEPTFRTITLDRQTHNRCVALSVRLGLPLAGIDLRRMPDGQYVCFEVNPSPAFSYYEANSGLPIAAAIARYLAGETG